MKRLQDTDPSDQRPAVAPIDALAKLGRRIQESRQNRCSWPPWISAHKTGSHSLRCSTAPGPCPRLPPRPVGGDPVEPRFEAYGVPTSTRSVRGRAPGRRTPDRVAVPAVRRPKIEKNQPRICSWRRTRGRRVETAQTPTPGRPNTSTFSGFTSLCACFAGGSGVRQSRNPSYCDHNSLQPRGWPSKKENRSRSPASIKQ